MRSGITAIELDILEGTWGGLRTAREATSQRFVGNLSFVHREQKCWHSQLHEQTHFPLCIWDAILTTNSAKYKRVGRPHKHRTSVAGHTRYVQTVLDVRRN
jgi:hypothetical protein